MKAGPQARGQRGNNFKTSKLMCEGPVYSDTSTPVDKSLGYLIVFRRGLFSQRAGQVCATVVSVDLVSIYSSYRIIACSGIIDHESQPQCCFAVVVKENTLCFLCSRSM